MKKEAIEIKKGFVFAWIEDINKLCDESEVKKFYDMQTNILEEYLVMLEEKE